MRAPQLSHRVAFYLVHGRWPEPTALHGCDFTLCCNADNPGHIHEGTARQNSQECLARGRFAVGQRSGMAKLTDEQAQELYRRYWAGEARQVDLAAEYGITQPSVSYIVRGLRHLPQ